MEIGKYLKFIFILTGIILIPVFNIQAYNDETTHLALTKETIELFNHQYPNLKLFGNNFDKVVLGSKEEDFNIRPLNHFYDPVYKKGLNGLGLSMLSAKDWAQNTRIQAGFSNLARIGITKELFSAETDYSWERAIFDYVHNDKGRALEALGHILHLIQDMSVPPHVRNDDHLIGRDDSPYEIYTKNFNKDNIRDISSVLENNKEILFDNIDDYFESLASFTNNNFFSKDTVDNEIRSTIYTEPVVDFEKEDIVSGINFGYKSAEGYIYKLAGVETISGKKEDIKSYFIEDKNDLILQDYWQILSKQAVLHGAGVIKLFFDEVEKERKTLVLLDKNISNFRKFTSNVKKGFNNMTGLASETFVKVNKRVSEIDRMDLVASVGEVEGDFEVEDLGGYQNPQLQNHPIPKESEPEDPNSPELKRLALILRETERMTGRLKKDIKDLEELDRFAIAREDGRGGTLLVTSLEFTKTTENTDEENKLVQEQKVFIGFGGGGGAAPTSTISSETTEEIEEDIISSPQIIIPENFSQFATTTITFSGTASSTQNISTDFSIATTTVQNDDTWELTLNNFNQGTTTIQFFANNNQNTSTSTATVIEIFVDTVVPDTTAPDVASLEISQCNNSMSATSCLITNTTLDILWATTSPSTDFAYFNINNNGAFSTTTATSTQVVNLNDGDTFTFSVATVDENNNASATTTQIVKINQMPVIISEIAWAGTEFSSDDEWIELYNRSDEDIDLSEWSLYSVDGSPNLNLSDATDKIIESNSYYLIERTDNNTVSDVTADFITPFSGSGASYGLNNTGENLILAYKKSGQATTTVDQAPFGNDWIYKDGYRTLERYNYNLTGNNTDNWDLSVDFTASFDLLNGEDADGNRIDGTPKARNSINYKIAKNGTLSEDKTITKANSPYVIVNDALTIQADKTLTIGEGVIIKLVNFNSEITINGDISANGSSEEPIIFTSVTDDTGGDTNGDGDCELSDLLCPGIANNFWSEINFSSNSQNSEFDNTIFRYGGNNSNASVVLNGATANFSNSTFASSTTSGLNLISADSVIENCNFKNNKNELGNYGLHAHNSELNIQNSLFDNNYIGLYLTDSIGSEIISNEFNNQSNFPIKIGSSPNINITNNFGNENGTDGINIFGAMTNTIATTTFAYNPFPYVLDNVLTTAENTGLEISPSTTFKFDENGSISVAGYLHVNGSENDKVIFTSIYDDGITATSSIEKKGGINFHSAISTIENAEFRYLHQATAYKNTYGIQAPIDLKNVIYSHNTWSIFADNEDTPVNRNENVQFVGTQSMSQLDNW